MMQYLSNLDWCTFIIVQLLTLFVVYKSYKLNLTKNTILEHLLMGRKLSLPLFIATLTATWYGNIIGVTQIAFNHGLYALLTQGIFWYLSYIIFAIFLVKKLRNTAAMTFPERVKHMYGEKSAKLTACIAFIKTLPITYGTNFGILIHIIWNIPLSYSIIIGVLLVAGYTAIGSFRAVVFTDCVQCFVMYASVISVVVFAYQKFGGYSFLIDHLPTKHMSYSGGHSILNILVWLVIAFGTVTLSTVFTQRCLAAQSSKVAIKGIMYSTILWIIFDLCVVFGSLYAKAATPEESSNYAYVLFSMQVLPEGFRGIFLAGMLATILSSLDSTLFISSNILSYDLSVVKVVSPNRKNIIAVALAAIVTILLALPFKGDLEKVWLVIKGTWVSCFLMPILWGYFLPNSISDKQCVMVIILGLVANIVWRIFNFESYSGISPFYLGLIITCICLFIYSFPWRILKK